MLNKKTEEKPDTPVVTEEFPKPTGLPTSSILVDGDDGGDIATVTLNKRLAGNHTMEDTRKARQQRLNAEMLKDMEDIANYFLERKEKP